MQIQIFERTLVAEVVRHFPSRVYIGLPCICVDCCCKPAKAEHQILGRGDVHILLSLYLPDWQWAVVVVSRSSIMASLSADGGSDLPLLDTGGLANFLSAAEC
jgi:hypothetical protein